MAGQPLGHPGRDPRRRPQGLLAHLAAAGGLAGPYMARLADHALAAATAQQLAVPAERPAASLVRELAAEALACRQRIAQPDENLGVLLDRHPNAALIAACPAWGPP